MSSFSLSRIADLAYTRMCDENISARAALKKVWKASFSQKQRNRLYELIREKEKPTDSASTDAQKNSTRQEAVLGEDF
jgi:hypothetical protein